MNTIQEYIDVIDNNYGEFIQLASSVSPELMDWKPSAEAWSVREVLAHIHEAIPYWMNEFENIVTKKEEKWGRNHLHEGRLQAVADANKRSAAEILEAIKQDRQDTIDIFKRYKDEDLKIVAESRNPRWGEKPMSFMLDHLVVEHLDTHTKQIQRNISQYSS